MKFIKFLVVTAIVIGGGLFGAKFYAEKNSGELPAVLDQFGKNVLLVYGGGSIKRNGLYQQITDLAQK
ncbi:hypothetical protein DRJ71_18360, partial [Enterococcus faecalis]